MPSLLILPTPEKVREHRLELHAQETFLFRTRAVDIAQFEQAVRGRAHPTGLRALAFRTLLMEERPSVRRGLEAAFVELASAGATADELLVAAERVPLWIRGRAHHLARTVREYERFLALRKLTDSERAPAEDMIAKCPLLDGVEHVEIKDIVAWSPSRLALLRRLAAVMRQRAGQVTVEIPHSDEAALSEALDPVYRAIEAMGDGVELRTRPLRLERGRVGALTASTTTAELHETVSRVRDRLAEGIAPSRIVIAARGMSELSPELSASLRSLGIPSSSRIGAPMTSTATYRLARTLALLTEPEEITRERVAAIIGSSLVDLRRVMPNAPAPQLMVRHLRAAAVRSRVADDEQSDGFSSRLTRYAAAQERSGHPEAAELVRRTIESIQRLFKRLEQWPLTATWAHHSRAMLELLRNLGVAHQLQDVGFAREPLPSARPALSDETQAQALAVEQAAWWQLEATLNGLPEAISLLGLSEQRTSRTDFVTWLDQCCADRPVGAHESNGASVELAELEDLAGRHIDHLFVVGVYEGRLPETVEPPPVFSDDERWQLNQVLGRPVFQVAPAKEVEFVLPARQLGQTLTLALAIESAACSVTLSRPRLDARGKPLTPSGLAELLLPHVPFEHKPLFAVDPRLATRHSESIKARRAAAQERIQVFRHAQPFGRFSGDIAALSVALAEAAPGSQRRPWSASALEKVANCRFRYLAEWLWRVKEEDEPLDQMGPLELGRLAHLAAEHAVLAIIKRKLWAPNQLREALEVGMAAASKSLDDEEPATVLGHPDLWAVTRDRMLARLRRLLEIEIRQTARMGDRPVGCEVAFGMNGSELPAVELGGVFVMGQVDRVDLGPGTVTILDYKSGRTEANTRKYAPDTLLETQFQLPLYVAALGRVLPYAKGRLVDAGYISLRDAQRTMPLSEALAAKAVSDGDKAIEQAIRGVVLRVVTGDFAVEPHTCTGCHLRPVCRIPQPENRP